MFNFLACSLVFIDFRHLPSLQLLNTDNHLLKCKLPLRQNLYILRLGLTSNSPAMISRFNLHSLNLHPQRTDITHFVTYLTEVLTLITRHCM